MGRPTSRGNSDPSRFGDDPPVSWKTLGELCGNVEWYCAARFFGETSVIGLNRMGNFEQLHQRGFRIGEWSILFEFHRRCFTHLRALAYSIGL